jgi:hypothetical protein
MLRKEQIVQKVMRHGLERRDAETAVDAYIATPYGQPYGADAVRVATILEGGK